MKSQRKRFTKSYTIEKWVSEDLIDYCKVNNLSASKIVNECIANFLMKDIEEQTKKYYEESL